MIAARLRAVETGPRRQVYFCDSGAGTRSRTRDLLITNQLLYQLSYAGLKHELLAFTRPHTRVFRCATR